MSTYELNQVGFEEYLRDPIIAKVRDIFISSFQQLAEDLSHRYMDRSFTVFAGAVGSKTIYKGYNLGIECLSEDDNIDLIALLEVDMCFIPEDPRLMAEVTSDNIGVESIYFKDGRGSNSYWPEATDITIDELRADMPRFIQAFIVAVEQRPRR